MKRRILAAVAIPLVAAAWCLPAVAAVPLRPTDYYGDRIVFDVLMDGDRIGEHVVRFDRRDDGLRVVAESDIRVKFLIFTAYKFRYRSETLWRDGRLVSLSARTNDNGDVTEVDARGAAGALRIDGPRGVAVADPGLATTDHWNPGVLDRNRVLNTITGQVNDVTIADLGEDMVETGEGPRAARHYAYRGELEAEVWYDRAGRWVRLRFTRETGVTIDYVCRVCGGGIMQAKAE